MDIIAPPLVVQSVTIPGPDGQPRIFIGVDDRGEACIRLHHKDGAEGASLSVGTNFDGPDSARLHLANADGQADVNLAAYPGGHVLFDMSQADEEGPYRGIVLEAADERVRLQLSDSRANYEWSVRDGRLDCGGGPNP